MLHIAQNYCTRGGASEVCGEIYADLLSHFCYTELLTQQCESSELFSAFFVVTILTTPQSKLGEIIEVVKAYEL